MGRNLLFLGRYKNKAFFFAKMKFNKTVLKNGLTVLHEKRDVPVTTVMLASKFGSMHESADRKGIAHFLEHMVFKGTKTRSAGQIASEVEKVGGILNAFTGEQETAFHVKLPSNQLSKAMEIIFDIYFNPSFPEEEIKKEANVICEEIRMYNDDPFRHVLDKIKECLYKDPFGLSATGSEENVRSFGRRDFLEVHDNYYSASNSILSVVGNNEFEEVVALAEKFSKDNPVGKISIPKIENQILNITEERNELQQANLAIGFHFPNSLKYAADVFTTILGEGMSSKLFTEVREKRGMAYAVKTYQEINKDYGFMVIYVGTEKNKVAEVIKLCVEEVKKMSGISDKELAEGKQQLIGNFEVGKEDSSNACLALINEEINGKAEDYYVYKENIENVKLEEIKTLAGVRNYGYFVLSPK